MVTAYILIQTEVGRAHDVAVAAMDIPGVTAADDVIGPYDVIVQAQADNGDELGRLVLSRIQAISGLTRTLTCQVVKL